MSDVRLSDVTADAEDDRAAGWSSRDRAAGWSSRDRAAGWSSRDRADCLHRAISALVGAVTVEEVVEVVFRDALPLLGAHVAVVFLLSEDGREFRALRLKGPSEREREEWQTFPADTPVLIADAVRARAPIVLPDLAAHGARYPLFAETRAAHGEGISVAFPFLLPDRATGGIGLLLPEGKPFDADDGAFLTTLAGVCAQALERARLHQRERHIAVTLQEAVQPPLPASAPGLRLAHFMKPALEESGIGGDFADVFTARDGRTVLAVGDLSGKGLAAAAQIAAVRPALRYALHDSPTLADPVTRLNRVLNENGMLTGFATLFVGRYDGRDGVLTYVNCGQEPGLVRRAATGAVEALPPTGPVLGAWEGAAYLEGAVTLEAGDVLALFTDGLSEAGPTRTALLTGDGVAALLGRQAGGADPQEIVTGVMAGVNAHAGQGTRDDQYLLVAVVAV